MISIVDPWVPRIRNNDEYLQRGLDFTLKLESLLSEGEKKEEVDQSCQSMSS